MEIRLHKITAYAPALQCPDYMILIRKFNGTRAMFIDDCDFDNVRETIILHQEVQA